MKMYVDENENTVIEEYSDLCGGWRIINVEGDILPFKVEEVPVYGGSWTESDNFMTLKTAFEYTKILT